MLTLDWCKILQDRSKLLAEEIRRHWPSLYCQRPPEKWHLKVQNDIYTYIVLSLICLCLKYHFVDVFWNCNIIQWNCIFRLGFKVLHNTIKIARLTVARTNHTAKGEKQECEYKDTPFTIQTYENNREMRFNNFINRHIKVKINNDRHFQNNCICISIYLYWA